MSSGKCKEQPDTASSKEVKQMNSTTTIMEPQDELVEILLDFIIVSASLAKKINQVIKQKQFREGGIVNGQNQRTGHGNQQPAQSCRSY